MSNPAHGVIIARARNQFTFIHILVIEIPRFHAQIPGKENLRSNAPRDSDFARDITVDNDLRESIGSEDIAGVPFFIVTGAVSDA